MDEALTELGEYIADRMDPPLTSWKVAAHELSVVTPREQILDTLKFLRDDARCASLPVSLTLPALIIPNAPGASMWSIICCRSARMSGSE